MLIFLLLVRAALLFFYYKLISDTMSINYSSENLIESVQSEPNGQVNDGSSERQSSKLSRQNSQRESSIGKSRPLVRKPDTQNSNFQNYKSLKRKSQEKNQKNPQDAPPKYPKIQQRENNTSTKTNTHEQRSQIKSSTIIRQQSKIEQQDMVKFKKKAMTKKQIIQIKDYVQSLEGEDSEINSVAGTQKIIHNTEMDAPYTKQLNKKSKTQYFHIQDFQKDYHLDAAQSQNLSQSDRNFIVSLKQKCKSVDQNNSLLQKRISWLREEVEMHLQRQLTHQKQKLEMEKVLKEKQKQLKEKDMPLIKQNQRLRKQLTQKDSQMERLKNLFIDLHNRFQLDKEILSQEIDLLKSEKETEEQQREKCEQRVKQLEQKINALLQQKKQTEFCNINTNQQYSKSLIQKIMNENKYLKVQNHILVKYKQEVIRYQKELKKVCNERDSLKKKIIESAKRQIRKYRQKDESQSDQSQLFTLSEISITSSSFKKS